MSDGRPLESMPRKNTSFMAQLEILLHFLLGMKTEAQEIPGRTQTRSKMAHFALPGIQVDDQRGPVRGGCVHRDMDSRLAGMRAEMPVWERIPPCSGHKGLVHPSSVSSRLSSARGCPPSFDSVGLRMAS